MSVFEHNYDRMHYVRLFSYKEMYVGSVWCWRRSVSQYLGYKVLVVLFFGLFNAMDDDVDIPRLFPLFLNLFFDFLTTEKLFNIG